jgi:hypothetical protein
MHSSSMPTTACAQAQARADAPSSADRSSATSPAKRAWQTPQIMLLDAEETETGVVTAFEAMSVNMCVAKTSNAGTSMCTAS